MTDKLFQVALNIVVTYSSDTDRYKSVYEKLNNLCSIPGKSLSSSVHIKREEYNPDSHIAFLVNGQSYAEEIVKRAKESGLVIETHIDQF